MLALLGSSAWSGTAIDEHTTFLATFEESAHPVYCVGDWRERIRGDAALTAGKFGQALALKKRQTLAYGADGKINLEAGTVEFWVLWTEDLAKLEKGALFSFVSATEKNYIHFNKVRIDRFGMPMKGGPLENFKWQRVDLDPTGWTVGAWRHIAGTWDNGVTKIYLDGELVDHDEGGAVLIEAPQAFSVGPGPLVIDELRISSIARSAEEIAATAAAQPGEAVSQYLTSTQPTAAVQALGSVGIDAQMGVDDREMPLVIGDRAYARGVAIRAPGHVEFELPAGMVRLTGSSGLSPCGRQGAAALTFSLDGKQVMTRSHLESGAPAPLDLPVQGGGRLRIEARVTGDRPGAVVVVGDALLLGPGVKPPPSFSRKLSKGELTIQKMRNRTAGFTFDLPQTATGYAVYAGHPVDEVDPALEPLGERSPRTLAMQASPGEYEAVQFTVCAARDLPSVVVTTDSLHGDKGAIPGSEVKVYLIRRTLYRKGYWKPRLPSNFEPVSRFLFPNRKFALSEGDFKEVHVLVRVPEDAAAGSYAGAIRIAPRGLAPTAIELRLTVHPIKLVQPRHKRYGMYYRMRGVADKPKILDAEFADLAAHGCTMIKGHAAIEFAKDENGQVAWDFSLIRTMLEGGRRHGFHGPITIYDNLPRLAPLMGCKGLDKKGEGDPVSGNAELLSVARRCFAALKQLNTEYPEYEFLLTHMDEVFGRSANRGDCLQPC